MNALFCFYWIIKKKPHVFQYSKTYHKNHIKWVQHIPQREILHEHIIKSWNQQMEQHDNINTVSISSVFS